MTDPLANEIELSGANQDLRVTLGMLGEDLVSLVAAREQREFDLPLVVMNACGSARMHATNALSFPYLFLQNGNCGFVGSEIEIPDDVAAEFSKAMYERFLLGGQLLGQAILGARHDLLRLFRNPLGIAFSSYADPELHVRPAEEENLA